MLVIAILSLFSVCMAAKNIGDCPKISTGIPPPKDVHDLHPSHIKVIASIGDSITAGVGAENIDTPFVTFDDFKEYRGLSWLSGGLPEATSIANYIKHFSPDVFGSSTGQRKLRICPKTFFCLDYGHDHSTDNLNAAIPSAVSNSIEDQVNYLIKYIGRDSPYAGQWKLVNIFLGTNDLSVSCDPAYGFMNFKSNMEKGLALLEKNVDHVIVNLIGLAETQKIPGLTDKEPGYRKTFENSDLDPQNYECLCCRVPLVGKPIIALHVILFNDILQHLAKKYGPGGSLGSDTFSVAFQPFHLDVSSLPPDVISNLDGYHPNKKAYRYFSIELWARMFLSRSQKHGKLVYKEDAEIFCPDENSRIRTD